MSLKDIQKVEENGPKKKEKIQILKPTKGAQLRIIPN